MAETIIVADSPAPSSASAQHRTASWAAGRGSHRARSPRRCSSRIAPRTADGALRLRPWSEARKLRPRMRSAIDGSHPRKTAASNSRSCPAKVASRWHRSATCRTSPRQRSACHARFRKRVGVRRARAAFLSTVNHESAGRRSMPSSGSPTSSRTLRPRRRTRSACANMRADQRRRQDLLRIISAMIDITRPRYSGVYDFDAERWISRPPSLMPSMPSARSPRASRRDRCRPAEETLDALIDRRAFRAVMHQLLSNAVKFGKAAPHRGQDVGRGIAGRRDDRRSRTPACRPTSWRRSAQLRPRRRGTDTFACGVGLGLSLAGGLMALHGGEISSDSAPGEGTSVVLRLPRAPSVPNNVRSRPPPRSAPDGVRRGCVPSRDQTPCLISTPPPSIALAPRRTRCASSPTAEPPPAA